MSSGVEPLPRERGSGQAAENKPAALPAHAGAPRGGTPHSEKAHGQRSSACSARGTSQRLPHPDAWAPSPGTDILDAGLGLGTCIYNRSSEDSM